MILPGLLQTVPWRPLPVPLRSLQVRPRLRPLLLQPQLRHSLRGCQRAESCGWPMPKQRTAGWPGCSRPSGPHSSCRRPHWRRPPEPLRLPCLRRLLRLRHFLPLRHRSLLRQPAASPQPWTAGLTLLRRHRRHRQPQQLHLPRPEVKPHSRQVTPQRRTPSRR